MEKQEIVRKLREWFNTMLLKYEGLTFKYEYSSRRDVYLVSYMAAESILSDETFCGDVMSFEDRIDFLYGDSAPLFTENEDLFHLSENANIVTGSNCSFVQNETKVYTINMLNLPHNGVDCLSYFVPFAA